MVRRLAVTLMLVVGMNAFAQAADAPLAAVPGPEAKVALTPPPESAVPADQVPVQARHCGMHGCHGGKIGRVLVVTGIVTTVLTAVAIGVAVSVATSSGSGHAAGR